MRSRVYCLFIVGLLLSIHSGWSQETAIPKLTGEPGSDAPADLATDWQTQTKEILNILGDDKLPTARRAALFEKLMKVKPSATEDVRLQFAYALLATSLKRYGDAQKITAQILTQADDYAPARALNARLLLLSNKTSQAVVELETLIESFDNPSNMVTEPQLEHCARLVGLVVGYFSGPADGSLRATALAELVTTAQAMPEPFKTAYESARLAIEEEFRILTEEGEQALKELREGLEKEAVAMRQKLEEQREKAASETDYARAEIQTNFAALNSQWQNTWNMGQAISREGDQLLRQELSLQLRIGMVPPPARDAQGRVNPNDQQRYIAEVNALQAALNNINYRIATVANQFDRVRAQGMLIERQMAATQAKAQQLGMTLAMQNESFNRLDAAIKQKEAAATKAEPKKKTPTQARLEKAFVTYDDFNVHKEKKLLADALDK
jgi:Tetratricopeptide repeat